MDLSNFSDYIPIIITIFLVLVVIIIIYKAILRLKSKKFPSKTNEFKNNYERINFNKNINLEKYPIKINDKSNENNFYMLKNIEEKLNNLFNLVKNNEEKLNNLLINVAEIHNKFNDLNNNLLQKSNDVIRNNISTQNETFKTKTTYKYLKGESGNIFRIESDDPNGSFFRLFNEKDGYADFEFCGNDKEAISNRIFSNSNICKIIKGNPLTANKVKTLKPGKVKKQNEVWFVISPIEVELL